MQDYPKSSFALWHYGVINRENAKPGEQKVEIKPPNVALAGPNGDYMGQEITFFPVLCQRN